MNSFFYKISILIQLIGTQIHTIVKLIRLASSTTHICYFWFDFYCFFVVLGLISIGLFCCFRSDFYWRFPNQRSPIRWTLAAWPSYSHPACSRWRRRIFRPKIRIRNQKVSSRNSTLFRLLSAMLHA